MQSIVVKIIKVLLTLALFGVAFQLGSTLWFHYMESPWTRDGKVRVDIVNIASDVSGLVTEVYVTDNQFVHKGDPLFSIDSAHYKNALSQAQALVVQRQSILKMKQLQATRRQSVDDQVISHENRVDATIEALSAQSDYEAAISARNEAQLNLDRTLVVAPVDGWVTNLLLRPGDFAQQGSAKLGLIDQHSFWIHGYFEENKVKHIKVGDKASVRLLGSNAEIVGHVDSIARAITDRESVTDPRQTANINPSFNWIRLAQRIPVRIALDEVPEAVTLIAGMSCTVVIEPTP